MIYGYGVGIGKDVINIILQVMDGQQILFNILIQFGFLELSCVEFIGEEGFG